MNFGLFSHIVKIRHTLVAEADISSKSKRKISLNLKANYEDRKRFLPEDKYIKTKIQTRKG